MLFDFRETPGYYFVAATLVPLASFVLLLLWSALWAAARPYRDTDYGALIYNFFGGDKPGRAKSYVAFGAIVIAFLLCATGFGFFLHQHLPYYRAKQHLEHLELIPKEDRDEAIKTDLENTEKQIADYESPTGLAKAWSAHWDWLHVSPSGIADSNNGTQLRLGFRIDSLNALMFVMVTFVASLIHLFSMGYMSDELSEEVEDHHVHTADGHLKRRGRFGRFFMYLSLFCFSMLNLILADNLFQVFVSWELVGICSYLLVGFYYERRSASNAANKAFITNRVGDAGFIIGLLILWTYCGTFNFEEIFHKIRAPESNQIVRGEVGQLKIDSESAVAAAFASPLPPFKVFDRSESGSQVLLFPRETEIRVTTEDEKSAKESAKEVGRLVPVQANPKATDYSSMPYWMLILAGLGIFLGCIGKSAQFPLQVWLPDAMEGPTPVSALIHAATMVAAGVYLVGRCYPLFTPEALLVIAYVGAITLFVAASIAMVMTDIKKVLAYSTVSQLGYMMLALGVGGWMAGLLHLITHAFFKALLFLGSGSVIYGCHHEQDMRKMGGLFSKMKITALTMLMGVLAIAGIPLFTGWYSKDAILANAYGFAYHNPRHVLLFLLPLGTAGLTAFYMFRMWALTFLGKTRDVHVRDHAHESPWLMTVPLILLAVMSICVAWGWPVWDAKESAMLHLLEESQPGAVKAMFSPEIEIAESMHFSVGLIALGIVAIGILFASLLYVYHVFDPNDAREQFRGLHGFLEQKWYFDELYSVMLVRPALVVAHWFKAFDLKFIDGIIHGVAAAVLWLTKLGGRIDSNIVDGLVNVVGDAIFSIGAWLRGFQTGFLRSYVLFLALAAVGIFVLLSYFVAVGTAMW